MVLYKYFFAVLLCLCCSLSSADFFPDYEDDNPLPHSHERIRRFVKFSSRKPGPDALPERGIGFKGHLMNLLKGGTLGMEFHIPHVDRLGRRFPYWKDWFGNKRYIFDKDEEKVDNEVKMKDEEEIENEIDIEDEGQDSDEDEDEEEIGNEIDVEDEGKVADEEEDEKENELEMENREENERDYIHLINPRVKDREP